LGWLLAGRSVAYSDADAHHCCMATPSVKGKQVQLIVNVWYDPGTRRVHVTSNDPDLGPKGLSTNLKPNSQADRSARLMLAKHGKLPDGA